MSEGLLGTSVFSRPIERYQKRCQRNKRKNQRCAGQHGVRLQGAVTASPTTAVHQAIQLDNNHPPASFASKHSRSRRSSCPTAMFSTFLRLHAAWVQASTDWNWSICCKDRCRPTQVIRALGLVFTCSVKMLSPERLDKSNVAPQVF